MRTATIKRKTMETDIEITINLDGTGKHNIQTGIGFFDHMLASFSVHSKFDLDVKCTGDLHIDMHHTVEDIGIVLGQCLKQAFADKVGITRFAHVFIPMDEALAFCSVDISGRPYLVFDAPQLTGYMNGFDPTLAVEFFRAFAFNAGMTLHLKAEYGENLHHIIEALFKACARTISSAAKITGDQLPSSKGILD